MFCTQRKQPPKSDDRRVMTLGGATPEEAQVRAILAGMEQVTARYDALLEAHQVGEEWVQMVAAVEE